MSFENMLESKITRRDALRALSVLGVVALPFSKFLTGEATAAEVETFNFNPVPLPIHEDEKIEQDDWVEIHSRCDAIVASGDFYLNSEEEFDLWDEEAQSLKRGLLYFPRSTVSKLKSQNTANDKIVIHYGEGMEQAKELAVAFRKKGIPSLAMASDNEDRADIFYGGGRLEFTIGPDGLRFLLNQYR